MSKKQKPLQMSIFESGMTATVETTELYGAEPGGIFDFIGLDWKLDTIVTCWGDLCVMCNALEDYADVLDRVIVEWGLEGHHAISYGLHAARCRKIARKYAAAIDYDRAAALEKCKKRQDDSKDDVGEEAMALLAKYGSRRAAESQAEKVKAPPAPTDEGGELLGQKSLL